MFFKGDDNRIAETGSDYRSGKLLTGDLKQILVDKVCDFLHKHWEKRKRAHELVEVFKREEKLAGRKWATVHS